MPHESQTDEAFDTFTCAIENAMEQVEYIGINHGIDMSNITHNLFLATKCIEYVHQAYYEDR